MYFSLRVVCEPFYFFSLLFIHSAFRYVFWLPYFSPESFGFSCIRLFSCHLLPITGRNVFLCFGMSCFVCTVLPFVSISLIFLLSPRICGLFPQVVFLFLLFVLAFPFCLFMFHCFHIVLSFWPVLVDFLSAFPVEFPFMVLFFTSCFLRWSQCSHQLISSLHRLFHLIWLYYSLNHNVVFDLFYSFPSKLIHSRFLNDGKVVF